MAARQVKSMGDQGRFGQREPRAVNAGPDSPRLTASETSRKAHDQVASPSDFELSGSRREHVAKVSSMGEGVRDRFAGTQRAGGADRAVDLRY
jgi:hypothetical protein